MTTLVGDVLQPGADMGVGGRHIQRQHCLVEGGSLWCDKTALEVALERSTLPLVWAQ